MKRTVRTVVTGLVLGAGAVGLSACGAGEDDPDLVAGKQLFVENCGACHTLARAGTKGTTGPNLDEAFQQALKDGMGRNGIEGVVEGFIDEPLRKGPMPADIVTGDDAVDVSAYVAQSVAARGEDTGLLATAVKKAGDGKPIAAEGGVLTIPADPGGQLAYTSSAANAEAGSLKVASPNEAAIPHNIVIDGKGEGDVVDKGGTSEFEADFAAGEYTFYCSVPGHREGGMEGKLTVK